VPPEIDPRDPQPQSQNQEQHVSEPYFQELSFRIDLFAGEIFWEASPGFFNMNESKYIIFSQKYESYHIFWGKYGMG
jgi:hypothetical protein